MNNLVFFMLLMLCVAFHYMPVVRCLQEELKMLRTLLLIGMGKDFAAWLNI